MSRRRSGEGDAALPAIELDADGAVTEQVESGSDRSSLAMVVAAVAIVALAAVVSWVFSDSDDAAEVEPPPTTQPDTTPTTAVAAAMDEGGLVAMRGLTAEQLLAEVAATGFSGRLAYASGETIVTIDLTTGQVAVASPSTRLEQPVAELVLVVSESRSMALDPADLEVAYLVTAGARVIDAEVEDEFVIVTLDEGRPTSLLMGLIDIAPQLTLHEIPDGASVVEAPGVGVFVAPTAGGTYQASRLGYRKVADGRIVAAWPGGWLEDRCDERLRCAFLAVDFESGAEVEVPREIVEGRRIVVSPNGRWIFSHSQDDALLFDVKTNARAEVGFVDQLRPVWTDDSGQLLAIRHIEGMTELWAFESAERTVRLVDLAALRVPAPTDLAVVTF